MNSIATALAIIVALLGELLVIGRRCLAKAAIPVVNYLLLQHLEPSSPPYYDCSVNCTPQ